MKELQQLQQDLIPIAEKCLRLYLKRCGKIWSHHYIVSHGWRPKCWKALFENVHSLAFECENAPTRTNTPCLKVFNQTCLQPNFGYKYIILWNFNVRIDMDFLSESNSFCNLSQVHYTDVKKINVDTRQLNNASK